MQHTMPLFPKKLHLLFFLFFFVSKKLHLNWAF